MQRIMMWANMRRGPSLAVPAPFDDNSSPYWWYDRIANWAHEWAQFGITDVLFPSPLKTNAGAFRGADGYGPFDDYDIGSKNTMQFGGVNTRFGNHEQLRRAIAVCHANGLNVLLDVVMHQRMGGKADGTYLYLGADGKTLNGRFPKFASCFRGNPPRVPEDPVPSPADDFSFGDELCPVNASPHHYVWNGLMDAGDWLFRTTGADGARLDDMKGMNVDFMIAWMQYKAMRGKWFFGEFASGSSFSWYGGLGTNWWVDQVHGLASAADFDTHYNAIMPMCNDASGFWMGSLPDHGMIYSNPMKAVPFVESMDSDTNGFATVVNNKELGYAYLLGTEGLPSIYIRDYLHEPDCYGLMEPIRNLCWCSSKFANGNLISRLQSQHIYAFERSGPPGLIVALNGDTFNPSWYTITVQTNFAPGTRLHDFTGKNGQDCWVDGSGKATFGVPPAANGQGYGFWAPAEFQGQGIGVNSRSTTQDFDGAADLNIPPLGNSEIKVGRVWCGKGQTLAMAMLAANQQPADFAYKLRIGLPDGSSVTPTGRYHTPNYGWYTLYATGVKLSSPVPFTLRVNYSSTQHLDIEDFGT